MAFFLVGARTCGVLIIADLDLSDFRRAPGASLLVCTDLDASLLNETDYRWDGAAETICWLQQHSIPLVLASSKTAAEMRPLAEELGTTAPLICENGASIAWPHATGSAPSVSRQTILERLASLRQWYAFRSFVDLGVEGIVAATGLSRERAALANERSATEPLLWDDDLSRIEAFAADLAKHDLTLTKGGRFWHVAGHHDKADAMGHVVTWYREQRSTDIVVIAVGDSPNDLRMLEAADIAVVIPNVAGQPKIAPQNRRKVLADVCGSAGWGQAVQQVLDTLVSNGNG